MVGIQLIYLHITISGSQVVLIEQKMSVTRKTQIEMLVLYKFQKVVSFVKNRIFKCSPHRNVVVNVFISKSYSKFVRLFHN